MLIKTHSIVTVDPFCNIFTFNFFYHSKSHSMTMNIWTFEKEMTWISMTMNIWTFEKVLEYNINQTVTSKKSAYMDPFLSVDTLYYFTFLCLSSCPEYLRTKIEKVHWPLSQLVCCCLCVVISGPLPSTCPTSSACLPEEIYKHRPHDEDCQSTCEHLRIRKQCILSKQSRSCKLECRILIM